MFYRLHLLLFSYELWVMSSSHELSRLFAVRMQDLDLFTGAQDKECRHYLLYINLQYIMKSPN